MITLAHPLWLLLLVPLSLLWLRLARMPEQEVAGSNLLLVHPDLSPLSSEQDAPPYSSRWQQFFDGLAILLLVVALAQPQRIGDLIPEQPEGREIVMLIDTSRTMSIEDFELEGRHVARLDVLKGVVSRFVEARKGDRFGVIVFGSNAATLTPPSFNRDLVNGMLQQVQVGMAGDNTALGDAIGLALKQLRERQALRPALILFSDNTDSNAGEMTAGEAVELARRMGVAVYTVQIGSDLFAEGRKTGTATQNAGPDMPQIARLTGGRHYHADSTGSLQKVIDDIGALEQTVVRPSTRRQVQEWYGALLLLAACLFSASRLMQIRRMAA